jgi:hypothetical protein
MSDGDVALRDVRLYVREERLSEDFVASTFYEADVAPSGWLIVEVGALEEPLSEAGYRRVS